jgi:hypothetical protein
MTAAGGSWLEEAIATRDREGVQPNMGAAGERVNDARRHVRSAGLLAQDDPTPATAACHDAIRKTITAHTAAAGLRPRSGGSSVRLPRRWLRQDAGPHDEDESPGAQPALLRRCVPRRLADAGRH